MRSFAIAGAGDLARRAAARVVAAESLGLRPIGYFEDDVPVGTTLPQTQGQGEGQPALAVEGDLAALIKLARDGGVDYVYVALLLADEERVMALIHALSDTTAVLRAGFLRVRDAAGAARGPACDPLRRLPAQNFSG